MENNTINILFLGGAKRVSIGERFIEAGAKLGKTVQLFSYELDDYVPISAIATIIVGLRWKDSNLFEHLKEVVATHQIDIIVPFLDPSTVVAAKLKEQLPTIYIPVSEEKICDIFFNKATANDWFIANKFPVPHQDLTHFPLIAKPIRGSASQGIRKLNHITDLSQFLVSHDECDYLIQGFITGSEYTVDCYVGENGEVLSVVPRKRIETAGGEVTKSVTEKDEAMIAIATEVLQRAGFKGAITIQFLKDETGLYIMEINPRFGGGVIASIEAGADSPMFLLKDFLAIENQPVHDWQDKLLMMRANREFFRVG